MGGFGAGRGPFLKDKRPFPLTDGGGRGTLIMALRGPQIMI